MTNTYTAWFYSDAEYASTEIEADTTATALAAACKLNDEQGGPRCFEKYDEACPVNHIEILDQNRNELAHWRDADLLLRMAGPDLLEAFEFCEMTLADLEASKRKGYIAEAKKLARRAIARARPPALGNARHAECAAGALGHYQSVTRTDREAALGDLLADLMHWSDRNNFDFDLALSRAQGHYEAETGTPPVFRDRNPQWKEGR